MSQTTRMRPMRNAGAAATLAAWIWSLDAVFNYPTLAESYKVATLDTINKMRQVAQLSD
jgi:hypothetical protein